MSNERHSRGQRNLYEKMLRMVAVAQCPTCGAREIDNIMEVQHRFYKAMYNEGKSTKTLSKEEFSRFFEECQRSSILMFGISGMEEDSRPFDHGGK